MATAPLRGIFPAVENGPFAGTEQLEWPRERVVLNKPLASAGGCLYYVGPKKEEKREVIVDPERRRQVFLESHFTEIGNHLGQKKTVHRIQSRYYWLGIVKDVVDWVS